MTEQMFIENLAALAVQSKRLIVAIDGDAGSGKSTLAQKLKQTLGAQIIHIDDFFLQAHQRTPARLLETGGNLDYERFEQEVLQNLRKNISFDYRKFDCSTMQLGGCAHIECDGIIVVEGVYSLSPRFCRDYDMKVFLKIERDAQLARILERGGKEKCEQYKNLWIPLENKYFAEFQIESAADIVIE